MSVYASFVQNSRDSTVPLVNYYDVLLKPFLKKTNQDNLKQASIMEKAQDILVRLGVEEIYMRGSFSFGEADQHSDIDFFAVVDPNELEHVHQGFSDALNSQYPVIASCYDNVVDGYGGAGFTYVCRDNDTNKPLILDLYFGLKDVSPKKMLYEVPRIYSKDKNYCWLFDNNAQDDIPSKAAEYIRKFDEPASKADAMNNIYQEVMVVNATMMKHTERGQRIRMTNDNWHLIGACIQMAQVAMDRRSYRSPYYTGDKVIEDCLSSPYQEQRQIGQDLLDLVEAPANNDKARMFFKFSTDIMRKFVPDRYEILKNKIENYSQLFSSENGYNNSNVLKFEK